MKSKHLDELRSLGEGLRAREIISYPLVINISCAKCSQNGGQTAALTGNYFGAMVT